MWKLKDIINAYYIAKEYLSTSDRTLTPSQMDAFTGAISAVNVLLSGDGTQFQSNAYNACPPLQSIIHKKCQAITRGNIIAVDEDGNPIVSTGFKEAMKLIKKPNAYQNRNQFIRTIEAYINIYGIAYIYKVIPVGFSKPSALIVIPNNCITPNYNKPADILSNQANIIRYYTINLFGTTHVLSGEDTKLIYECKDIAENLSNGKEFEPKSRIDALRKPIENIVASLESRNHMITTRGADVILSPQKTNDPAATVTAMTDSEVKRLQEGYAKYGLLKGQFHTLISKVPISADKIGMSANDIGLFDGENADHRAIAEMYNVPIPILGLPDTTKFNTYLEAKTEFYEDAIIPESEIIAQMFDDIFDSEKNGYRFYFDFSNLECMQRSMKDKADTFSTMVEAVTKAKEAGFIDEATAKNTINDYLI